MKIKFSKIVYSIILFIIFTIFFLEREFIVSYIKYISESAPKKVNDTNFPKIVHLIYFPWDKTGKLKNNENDFNHDFYETFKNNNSEWEVRLWTLSKIKSFLSTNYPIYSDIWKIVKHPVQAVDFCRLIVTYHYGGIYWQYDSVQKVPLEAFIPPKNKSIRLFIENIVPKFKCIINGYEKIRQYKSEEVIRVATQVFSAYPKNDFLLHCINKSWDNLHKFTVESQYDILYIGGNAMISEAYDEYSKKDDIHLTYCTIDYIKLSSNGSWRIDKY